jgi:hypothetical protein
MTARIAKIAALASLCAAFGCKVDPRFDSTVKSLTTAEDDAKNPDRKKYFFGFRQVLDVKNMDNETFADNKHLADIAKDANGGGYVTDPKLKLGFLEVGDGGAAALALAGEEDNASAVQSELQWVIDNIKPGDMYLEMSAGHGYEKDQNGGGGLAVGVTHEQVRDAVVKMLDKGAKEVVIFMMACYSGGLIDAFQNDPRLFKDGKPVEKYKDRTIFVMSSSESDKTSSTGDNGVDKKTGRGAGSDGSAFGNALWRAMRGDADKAGNDDGVVTLKEIVDFVVPETQALGGDEQKPQVLKGFYDDNLPMKCIPDHPKAKDNPLCRTGSNKLSNGGGNDSVFDPTKAPSTTAKPGASTTTTVPATTVPPTTKPSSGGTAGGSSSGGSSGGGKSSGKSSTGGGSGGSSGGNSGGGKGTGPSTTTPDTTQPSGGTDSSGGATGDTTDGGTIDGTGGDTGVTDP